MNKINLNEMKLEDLLLLQMAIEKFYAATYLEAISMNHVNKHKASALESKLWRITNLLQLIENKINEA